MELSSSNLSPKGLNLSKTNYNPMKKFYKNLAKKREIVRNYIKLHPATTATEIKKVIGIKVEKTYKNGIGEAYKDSKVKLPPHLMKRSVNKRKQLVISFIKKHPNATITEIEKSLSVKVSILFGGIKNAFRTAKIPYPDRFEDVTISKNQIIKLIKKDPLITSYEINEKLGVDVYSLFDNLEAAYKLAGTKWISFRKKRKLRKQREIKNYIKKHLNVTQWEINKSCKTHVQDIFKGGIKEAFREARLKYPANRRIYGTAKTSVKKRAIKFQNDVINILKRFGDVKSQIKTKSGIVDATLKTESGILAIEIKNYNSKPISYSEIKQLDKYLNDLKCRNGVIICKMKNRGENKFKMGSHKIMIRTKDEILKDGVVV